MTAQEPSAPFPAEGTISVRRLTRADAPLYREFTLRSVAAARDAFVTPPEQRAREPIEFWERRIAATDGSTAAWGAFLRNEHGTQRLGKLRGEALVGSVATEISARPDGLAARLIGLIVDVAHRRAGLGGLLLRALLEGVSSDPRVRVVTLTVMADNRPAVALYRAHGFVKVRRERVTLDAGGTRRVLMLMERPLP